MQKFRFSRKLFNRFLYTTIPAICVGSLVIGFVTFSFSDKSSSLPNNISYQSLLSDTDCSDNSLSISPYNDTTANFMNFPTPRYNPIMIDGVYTSYNSNLYKDLIEIGSSKGWLNKKTYNWTPTADSNIEYYGRSEYASTYTLQNAKIGFDLNDNGSVRYVVSTQRPGFDKSFSRRFSGGVWLKNFIGSAVYDRLYDYWSTVAYVETFSDGGNQASQGATNLTFDSSNNSNKNFFGISRMGFDSYNSLRSDTSSFRVNNSSINWSYTDGIRLGNYSINNNGSFYPTNDIPSYLDSSYYDFPMMVLRLNRNVGNNFIPKYYIFEGDYFYYETGIFSPSLQLVISDRNTYSGYDKNYYFRIVKNNDVSVGLTGNNYYLNSKYSNIRSTLSSGSKYIQNLLYSAASNVPESVITSVAARSLEQYIHFSKLDWYSTNWRTADRATMRANLPVYYSPQEKRWFLMLDSFIVKDSYSPSNFSVDVDSNFQSTMKNLYPSQFIDGIKSGLYTGNNAALTLNFNPYYGYIEYWTTPTSWWRYNPRYTLTSDNKKGKVILNIKIPHYRTNTFAPKILHKNTSGYGTSISPYIYTFATPTYSSINVEINGFKNGKTSFKDVPAIDLGDQFSTLASNIFDTNYNAIENAIKQKIISNVSNYINNSCFLNLTLDDIKVTEVKGQTFPENGTCVAKISLKKFVNSNGQIEYDSTGEKFSKEYVIGGFYKISGDTKLNNSLLDISDIYGTNYASSITKLEIRDLIIRKQKLGVLNTVNTNYKDFSQEIFSNLGDFLSTEKASLQINNVIDDDDKGIKYIDFTLLSKFVTDSSGKVVLNNTPWKGSIILTGFKSKNSPINNFNSSTIYADQNGYIGSISNNQIITPNETPFNDNDNAIATSSNTVVLSQQYVNSLNMRAALVYDYTRPNNIVIELWNGNQKVNTFSFENSTYSETTLIREGSLYLYDSIDEIISSINAATYYDGNTKLDKSELAKYFVSEGPYGEYKNSFRATKTIHGQYYVGNNLAFNRLLDFNNAEGMNSSRMFIYNQSPILDYDSSLKSKSLESKFKFVEFNSSDSVSLKSIDTESLVNTISEIDAIYSASGYYDFYNNLPAFYLSFIGILDKRTYFNRIVFQNNSEYSILDSSSTDITDQLNFYNGDIYNTESFAYQPAEFSTTKGSNNSVISTMLITNPMDNFNRSSLTQQLYKFDDSNQLSPLSLNIEGRVIDKFLINYGEGSTDFYITNSSLTVDSSNWLSTIISNGKVSYLNVNLKDIASSGVTSVTNKHYHIMIPDQAKIDPVLNNNWIYSLNNNRFQKYTTSSNSENYFDIETKQAKVSYNIKDFGLSNVNISSVDKKYIQDNIINNNYWKLFTNQDSISNTVNVEGIYKNYSSGSVIANVSLSETYDDDFNALGKKNFSFIFNGFNAMSNATTIELTSSGREHFANVSAQNLQNELTTIVANKDLLNSYFTISNHPTANNLYDALDKTKPLSYTPVFDTTNSIAQIGFNLNSAYIPLGTDSVTLVDKYVIYSEINFKSLSSAMSDMECAYSDIFTTTPISPLELKDILLNQPNGFEANAIKNVIVQRIRDIGYSITSNEVMISSNIQYNSSTGEIFLLISVPKLGSFSDSFVNFNFIINSMRSLPGTTMSKRNNYKTNINPSKLQEYLSADVETRSLEFVNIENARSDTKIISANVLKYDDDLGTVTITFSMINFNLSGLNQSGSSEGLTLNATFEYSNLRGSSSESLTNMNTIINAPDNFKDQYAQNISANHDALINIIKDTNSIISMADNTNISILSSAFNNKEGKIDLLVSLDKYVANDGSIVNETINFNTSITGFKNNSDKTEITWNNVLPDLSYEQLKIELENNPSFVTKLVNAQNMVPGSNFTYGKVVNASSTTMDIYIRLDKSFSGDDYNTIIDNNEYRITISKSKDKYEVSRISLFNSEGELLEDNYSYFDNQQENNFYKYWYIFIIVPIILLVISLLISNTYKKLQKYELENQR